MGSGQDPRKGRAEFLFSENCRELWWQVPSRQKARPDPAHLRVLWWNNSKCLSCIVWHAAGGALKPLLPAPKAPLNKIVKNNSFTLIFPSDYCTQGGKLAAGPCASLFLTLLHLYCTRLLCSLLLVFSVHPSLPSKFFVSCLLIRHLSVWQARWTLHGRGGILLGQY